MEPMTVSNPSSPSSPVIYQSYLPSFLMGEKPPSSSSSNFNAPSSPEKSQPFSPYREQKLRQNLFASTLDSVQESSHEKTMHRQVPPKLGLFDSVEENNVSTGNVLSPTNMNESPQCSTKTVLNQSESFSCETADNSWVTVFGFPTTCSSIVLSRFLQCGKIVDKKFPVQGNWVHLKFSNPQEAARALALNGKLIAATVMVGVIPYHYRSPREMNKENVELSFTSPNRARSLRHSFVSPQRSDTVIVPQNVPQKSTGLVTKAMEYMFGW